MKQHHIVRVDLNRHLYLWWVWDLIAVDDDGSNPQIIASGANFTKTGATRAIRMWQQLYLRRLGKVRLTAGRRGPGFVQRPARRLAEFARTTR